MVCDNAYDLFFYGKKYFVLRHDDEHQKNSKSCRIFFGIVRQRWRIKVNLTIFVIAQTL